MQRYKKQIIAGVPAGIIVVLAVLIAVLSSGGDAVEYSFSPVALPDADGMALLTGARQAAGDYWALSAMVFQLESLPYSSRYHIADDIAALQAALAAIDVPDDTVEPLPEGMPRLVGSRNSQKYHISTCPNAETIAEHNLVEYKSAKDAEAQGKSPCAICGGGV